LRIGCAEGEAGLSWDAQDTSAQQGSPLACHSLPGAWASVARKRPARPPPRTFCAHQPARAAQWAGAPCLALHALRERQFTPTSVSPLDLKEGPMSKVIGIWARQPLSPRATRHSTAFKQSLMPLSFAAQGGQRRPLHQRKRVDRRGIVDRLGLVSASNN
jgi:hypothetical protein